MQTYKVVELTTVTEDAIEETLNEWSANGWIFDGMQFAMRESSKRPSMAFVLFTRKSTGDGESE
ncbi:MAG TPA: DUF4177 domain-containing protein [Desulfuromonadales bacterium]|nr:DUF4177 domain-containing protein [Desulfuromonadales bacterium]